MSDMFDLHTSEPCRGTLEQGIKPRTAYIGPCDGLVTHTGLDAAFTRWVSPVTPKGIKRLERRDERQTHIRRHVLRQETPWSEKRSVCSHLVWFHSQQDVLTMEELTLWLYLTALRNFAAACSWITTCLRQPLSPQTHRFSTASYICCPKHPASYYFHQRSWVDFRKQRTHDFRAGEFHLCVSTKDPAGVWFEWQQQSIGKGLY